MRKKPCFEMCFQNKGLHNNHDAEITADGNNFLESRGLHESWDLKGQDLLQAAGFVVSS